MSQFDWEFVPARGGLFTALSKAEAENFARMMPGTIRQSPLPDLSATHRVTESGRKVDLRTGRNIGPSNEWRPKRRSTKARVDSAPLTAPRKPPSAWAVKVPRLEVGNVVIFEDDAGRQRRGRVESVHGSNLVVEQAGGQRWKVRGDAVTKLLRSSIYDGPARNAPVLPRSAGKVSLSLSRLVRLALRESPSLAPKLDRLIAGHRKTGHSSSRHSFIGLPLVITSTRTSTRVRFASER